jgi:hypothetical protein
MSEQGKLAAYVDAFMGALRDGIEAPAPSNVQCLYCAHRVPVGGRADHLWQHIERDEFLGIVLLNALSWAKVPLPGVVLGVHSEDHGSAPVRYMGGRFLHHEELVRSTLTRYLSVSLLGPAA